MKKKDERTLVILNYAMDSKNPIFSHQIEAVNNLSIFFSKVVVVTSHAGDYHVGDNVIVRPSHWVNGRPLRNMINFLRAIVPELKKNSVVFSHMTDVQSAIIGPLTKFLGIKHYLWYAHASLSPYLRWSHFWVSSILTSTAGSCPINSPKVNIVGQAINPEIFFFKTDLTQKLISGIHIGRFDPPKRIDLIIEECIKIRLMGYQISLTQIGNPSGPQFSEYQNAILQNAKRDNHDKWLIFQESIPRDHLPSILQEMDFFIHAFDGSLDKTLIEATMCGLPVLTTNAEYLREFGTWTGELTSTLSDQFNCIYKMERAEFVKELFRRRVLCLEKHSSIHWQKEVSRLLLSS